MNTKPSLLVIEDCPDTAELFGDLASVLGYDARVALTGRAALAAFAQRRSDAVLMDLDLPDLTGFELVPMLRARGGERTRMIAATGMSRARDRVRARAVGFDDYLLKPFGAQALVSALAAPRQASARSDAGASSYR